MSDSDNTKKWVFIGVGLAAAATVGYLLFRSNKDTDSKAEAVEVERVNFVDPSLSQEELDSRITKWVDN